MLPKGCCRTVYYSAEYVPSYKCNFLGVSVDVSVPVDTALCVLIDATEAAGRAAVASGHCVSEYKLADEVCDEVMALSGPPSILLCAADTDELCDVSLFHYSVLHSSKALPSIGLCFSFCDIDDIAVNWLLLLTFVVTTMESISWHWDFPDVFICHFLGIKRPVSQRNW